MQTEVVQIEKKISIIELFEIFSLSILRRREKYWKVLPKTFCKKLAVEWDFDEEELE